MDYEKEAPLTMSVPEAGWRYLGIRQKSAYAAARKGLIPTIRVGRLVRVPIAAMEEMMKTRPIVLRD